MECVLYLLVYVEKYWYMFIWGYCECGNCWWVWDLCDVVKFMNMLLEIGYEKSLLNLVFGLNVVFFVLVGVWLVKGVIYEVEKEKIVVCIGDWIFSDFCFFCGFWLY